MTQNSRESQCQQKIGAKSIKLHRRSFLRKKTQFQLAFAISNAAVRVSVTEVQNDMGGRARMDLSKKKKRT